jgi:hypothetical protein
VRELNNTPSVLFEQGVDRGHTLMDGHPHRFSTDFVQTLLGGHLTRRGAGCPRVPLGT